MEEGECEGKKDLSVSLIETESESERQRLLWQWESVGGHVFVYDSQNNKVTSKLNNRVKV